MNGCEEQSRAALIAARGSYGRLLSWLAWRWRDIAAAEDALSDAYLAALQDWPRSGVPASPEGWLLMVAKRRLLSAARRRALAEDPALIALLESETAAPDAPLLGDQRLRLMFVCAHPAIDPTMRSALMLQTVLGIEAARIGAAFLISPEAMTKRLVRTKAKIKAARVRFEEPEPEDLPLRVNAVLEAIYGAYVMQQPPSPGDAVGADLAEEAIHLANLVAARLPDHAEALGLLALLLFCESRKPARLDEAGEFVPLDRQDPDLWDHAKINQAERLLMRAGASRNAGPFQIEAAIQAAHCSRVHGGPTPWSDIGELYETLLAMAPTVGARLGHAIAVAQARSDPHAGLSLLDALRDPQLVKHQPWWAARAHLLAEAGRDVEAAEAYGQALALSTDPAIRRHLERRISTLRGA